MTSTSPDSPPRDRRSQVAVVTGASAGLGWEVSAVLLQEGYRVVMIGRDQTRLEQARQRLSQRGVWAGDDRVLSLRCDVTDRDDVTRSAAAVIDRWSGVDLLVHCVGQSDRGLARSIAATRLNALIDANLTGAIQTTDALYPHLVRSGGSIVVVGSLASKFGPRYLGGYAAAKHALAGWTQQLRMEARQDGVHVGLVCPGPIRRDDAGVRYDAIVDRSLPASASAPGGGAKLTGLDPHRVARAIVRCSRRRTPEVLLPGKVRVLLIAAAVSPRLGDWLLAKFTGAAGQD